MRVVPTSKAAYGHARMVKALPSYLPAFEPSVPRQRGLDFLEAEPLVHIRMPPSSEQVVELWWPAFLQMRTNTSKYLVMSHVHKL